MSRSYRKPYASILGLRSMKAWRTQENRRLRHNAKQLINTCEDYDNLIIPVLNDFDTLYGSPRDGRNHWQEKPYLNQCEIDVQENHVRWGYWSPRYELVDGHHDRCGCYTNKRGAWYWKVKRK